MGLTVPERLACQVTMLSGIMYLWQGPRRIKTVMTFTIAFSIERFR